MNEILDMIAVGIVFAGVIPATLFPILYGRSPWRRSKVGRALMTKAVGIALLIDFSVLYVLLGRDAPGWLRVVVYGLVITGVWMQFVALVRVRYRGRTDFDQPPRVTHQEP